MSDDDSNGEVPSGTPSVDAASGREVDPVRKARAPMRVDVVGRQMDIINKAMRPTMVDVVGRQMDIINKAMTPTMVDVVGRQMDIINKAMTPTMVDVVGRQMDIINKTMTPTFADVVGRQMDIINKTMTPQRVRDLHMMLSTATASATLDGLSDLTDIAALVDVSEMDADTGGKDGPFPVEIFANVVALAFTFWLLGLYLSEWNRTGENVMEMNRLDLVQSLSWCVGLGLAARTVIKKNSESSD